MCLCLLSYSNTARVSTHYSGLLNDFLQTNEIERRANVSGSCQAELELVREGLAHRDVWAIKRKLDIYIDRVIS